MKDKIRSGRLALGVSVMIPAPQIVEMLGRLGFDWVLIDCEHGTISRESVVTMAMAAEVGGITPIARPGSNSDEAILQVLECGVLGVQVPHVNTAAEARRVVAAVKYHPLGSRGLAAGTRPAGYGYGGSPAEYVEEANAQTLVCVQIEEKTALDHLDEMLTVPGIDVFFVGPSDLAQSMGYPGRPDAPEVRAVVDRAIARIAASGKVAGTPGRTAEAVRDYPRHGILYAYTHMSGLLGSASRQFIKMAGQGDG